ncbi:MAG: hypothetical protein JWM55_1297 [Acidimicrobiaceae bacterium]|nr:hypothetical protein [Acidimicrobiaceae bacterium]
MNVAHTDHLDRASSTTRAKRTISGPRRTRSIDAYLRQTRLVALFALAALVAGVVSDFTDGSFWRHHSLLAGLVSSVLVVMLSAAVINEIIESRRRQRWSTLAQYVMFELVRNARMMWLGVLDVSGLLPSSDPQNDFVERSSRIVRDTSRLTTAVRAVLENPETHQHLHREIAFCSEHADEVLGRWAGVMLNVELYAEMIDRHVELAGDVSWIGAILDNEYPPDDARRRSRARSSPAVQIAVEPGSHWLAERVVIITQLAETLDRRTLEIALQIVPIDWWKERLGTKTSAQSRNHP